MADVIQFDPNTLNEYLSRFTESEKAIIERIMDGEGFANPDSPQIEATVESIDSVLGPVNDAINSGVYTGIGNITETQAIRLQSALTALKTKIQGEYTTHTNNVSGQVFSGEVDPPDIPQRISVASGYNTAKNSLKPSDEASEDFFSQFFFSVLGNGNVLLVKYQGLLQTILARINDQLGGFENAISQLEAAPAELQGVIDITNNAYAEGLSFLRKFAQGTSIAGLTDESDSYPHKLVTEVLAGNELSELVDNMIEEKATQLRFPLDGMLPTSEFDSFGAQTISPGIVSGPKGPRGDVGLGFSHRGDWSSSVAYSKNDLVLFDGTSYVNITGKSTTSSPNIDTANWNVFAARGETGPAGSGGVGSGVGPTGPQGATGPTGPAGEDGVTGPTGATGPAGTAGADGADGADGSTTTAARFYLAATTGSFTTTRTTLPFDTTHVSQSWASNSSGIITLDAGTYVVMADVTIDESAGNSRTEFQSTMQENSSGSYVDVVGTDRRHYSRNNGQGAQSASISAILVFATSASFQVQSRRASGSNTGEWIANGSSVTIMKIA